MELLITLFYILFVFSSIVLVVVILLQEGKGGGLGGALGAAGQQTFGVDTKGIQRFTGIAAAVFLATALSIHVMNRVASHSSAIELPGRSAPLDAGTGGGAGVGAGAGAGTGGEGGGG